MNGSLRFGLDLYDLYLLGHNNFISFQLTERVATLYASCTLQILHLKTRLIWKHTKHTAAAAALLFFWAQPCFSSSFTAISDVTAGDSWGKTPAVTSLTGLVNYYLHCYFSFYQLTILCFPPLMMNFKLLFIDIQYRNNTFIKATRMEYAACTE